MLKIGEWKAYSSVNHIDFDHQDFPTPAQYHKQYPGMNIRQIAEELEQTKDEDDMSIDEGRRYIHHLLKTKFKNITEAREEPSMVLAKKKTPPYFRLAHDFRRMNRMIESVKVPLRRIDEMIYELASKRYKSSLDQREAYTQIPYGLSISGDLYSMRKQKMLTSDGASVLLWIFI
mmetsp:Transcript_17753/g.28313  ORF Transcript_17753/g.28313 Transcript_17753/m.28313 type:complete len:175 (-) Transcript_17753:117-641(-)